MQKSPSLRSAKGETLMSALVGTAILGMLVVGAVAMMKSFIRGEQQAETMGQVEDMRNYVRQLMSCDETTTAGDATCKLAGGGYVNVLRIDDSVIIPKVYGSAVFGPYAMRAKCSVNNQAYALDIEYAKIDPAAPASLTWTDLFPNAPVSCLKELPPPPATCWVKAIHKNCPAYCASLGGGLTNKPTLEDSTGNYCASGEVRSASAWKAHTMVVPPVLPFAFVDGCWTTCAPGSFFTKAKSVGTNCYGWVPSKGQPQVQDNDVTDQTVACCCRL
jgi:hypothetical protein